MLDPELPLKVRPLELPTAMESQAQGVKMRSAMLDQQLKIRDMQDQQQLRQIFTDHVNSGGDPNDLKPVLGKVYAVNPMLGMKFQGMMQEQQKEQLKNQQEKFKFEMGRHSALADHFAGVLMLPEDQQPDAYKRAYEAAKAQGLTTPADGLAPEWSPAVKADLTAATIRHEKNRAQLEAMGIVAPRTAAAQQKTHWIQTQDEQGRPIQMAVPDVPGQQYPIAPGATKATVEGDKERRRQIDVSEAMGKPVPQEEKEWAKAFDKTEQNKLEQQYRQVLQRPLSNRSGGLGLEDAKVNQATHLMNIFDSSYNPKTKEYDIPAVMQEELALGLARLVSPNGQVGVELAERMNQPTAYGKIQSILSYVTGKPQTGSTQAVFKMFKDSIERQGAVAESNRDQYMDYLRSLAPTELDEERRKKVESGSLNSFVSRKKVDPEAMKAAKVSGGGRTVEMVAPDGRTLDVPEADVDAALKAGAKRK